MREASIVIEGETWLTVEAISECYDCEVTWVREVYEFGLLGDAQQQAGTLLFRVTILDRVAEIVRLNRYQGLGFEAIHLLIGDVQVQTFLDAQNAEAETAEA